MYTAFYSYWYFRKIQIEIIITIVIIGKYSFHQQINKNKVILTETPAVNTELGHSDFTGGHRTSVHPFRN